MLSKVNRFLTPNRRKAIYGVVAALVAALIAFNVISADDLSGSIGAIVTVLGGLASFMAFFNTSSGPNDS